MAQIRERKLSVRDKMHIELTGLEATVTKRMIGLRDHFNVEVDGAPDLKAHGNVVDHEYEIEGPDGKVAEVSKRWFRLRDTYGVEVYGDQNVPLLLAVTVAIDAMTRDHG
ncbi:MAG: hypothetical protein R2699_05785 [Acidimicrobiales bacterium]